MLNVILSTPILTLSIFLIGLIGVTSADMEKPEDLLEAVARHQMAKEGDLTNP